MMFSIREVGFRWSLMATSIIAAGISLVVNPPQPQREKDGERVSQLREA